MSVINIARRGRLGRMRTSRWRLPLGAVLVFAALSGCGDKESPQAIAQAFQPGASMPDELPRMLNTELPFHYPAALYARKVQGNVTLHLRVDADGRVVADSTRVEEKSAYPGLDTAAVKGAGELRFVPAKRAGEAMPVTILFPVYFRHPEARPLPGDTILTARSSQPASGRP